MIVCLCRGISDKDVRCAIDSGATCLGRLEQCGIGGDCRGCESTLEEMIGDAEAAGRVSRCMACCAESALATA